MAITTVLFDLDGTLLPMNSDLFMKIYFHEMGKAFEGIMESEELIKKVWAATHKMVQNTETRTNESVFMETFESLIDQDIKTMKACFDDFYADGYLNARKAVEKSLWIIKSIELLKEKGYQLVLATNPLFPRKAILERVYWAGLSPDDFTYIPSYEDNHFCKPHKEYYEEILSIIGKDAHECLMVGNDVQEDMVAGQLGMTTYLITNHMINRQEVPIICDYQGDYESFTSFVEELADIREI